MALGSELRTLRIMIRLFCRCCHGSIIPCDDCSGLLEYAQTRLAQCPFGDDKPTCQKCQIHCYSPGMRKHIAEVMRFSGPRMILRHPLLVLRHLYRARSRTRRMQGKD